MVLSKKLGILGGGQLGKMLCQASNVWSLSTHIMDLDEAYPAGSVATSFTTGDINNFEDVIAFGKTMDVVTIEIEHVNVDALFELEKMGVIVHPRPAALKLVKDKGLQKQFYKKHGIATAPFQLFESKEAILQAIHYGVLSVPFVQKARSGGYDGKGVSIIRTAQDLPNLLPTPSVVETMADIACEIAVIAARNASGEVQVFEAVGMEFHGEANLVEALVSPAPISAAVQSQANDIAKDLITQLQICGVLAVEFFLNKDGSLWVNEIAPRPHNSGHHTIENCLTSQYQQHIRGVMDLPLGKTTTTSPAVLLNLLGEPGYSGPAIYEGFEACIAIPGVFPHLYGKKITKPFRKMGHITILGESLEEAKNKAEAVKHLLKVIA